MPLSGELMKLNFRVFHQSAINCAGLKWKYSALLPCAIILVLKKEHNSVIFDLPVCVICKTTMLNILLVIIQTIHKEVCHVKK
jgi:hypothetical protein